MPATGKEIVVRGTLQQVAGIGGETTGWAIRLDRVLQIQGSTLNQIEIAVERVSPDALQGKYVEASGTLASKTGVERGSWPILQANSLKEVQADGMAEATIGQAKMKLSLDPASIVWEKVTSQPGRSGAKVDFTIANQGQSPLVLNSNDSSETCYLVRSAETRQILWQNPPVPSGPPAKLELQPGKSIAVSAEIPPSAATAPGTYILEASVCGHLEYALTTRFEVHPN